MSLNDGAGSPGNPRMRLDRETVQGHFSLRLEELSGQHVTACYQCGNCSSGCPLSQEMDILPSRIMRLAQLGQEQTVLRSGTIWICASCFQCTVRCPKGIDILAVMDALRQCAMEKGVDHFGPDQITGDQAAGIPQPGLVGVCRKFST